MFEFNSRGTLGIAYYPKLVWLSSGSLIILPPTRVGLMWKAFEFRAIHHALKPKTDDDVAERQKIPDGIASIVIFVCFLLPGRAHIPLLHEL